MGTFAASNHILNSGSLTKAQFKKAFVGAMKAQGCTTATEDDAALSFTLIFSPDRKWVTVLSEEYRSGGQETRADASRFAKSLGTTIVSVSLVDSDFAELELYDSSGKCADVMTLGESYLGDEAPMGTQESWQPLMIGGTWEQVTAIQSNSYTFAEDALTEFAPLIGMDGRNILLDSDDSFDEDNAEVLHFKKAAEKKLTLNNAFVKYFGEILLPHGFVKQTISKRPNFIRVINGEILQAVTYRQISARKAGYKNFQIYFGIMSLYREHIDLTESPECNLKNIHHFLLGDITKYDEELVKRAVDYHIDFWQKKRSSSLEYEFGRIDFHFNPEFLTGMEIARDIVAMGLIPIFERTKTLESCIDFFYDHNWAYTMDLFDRNEQPREDPDVKEYSFKPDDIRSEALALIVANYSKDITDYTERELTEELEHRGFDNDDEIEAYKARFRERVRKEIGFRGKILTTPKIKEQALEYAESVRQKNVELLRSYGLEISIDKETTAVKINNIATKKKLTLNAAFKQVFGSALEPLGFVDLTVEKHPYFVKVINNEILHIVTYRRISSRKIGYNYFEVYFGIFSLYRSNLDLTNIPDRFFNVGSMIDDPITDVGEELTIKRIRFSYEIWNRKLELNKVSEDQRNEFLKQEFKGSSFMCSCDDLYGMQLSLEIAQAVFLPIFQKTSTIKQCIDFFYDINAELRFYQANEEPRIFHDENSFNFKPNYDYSEALLLIVADYRDDITKYTEPRLDRKIKMIEQGYSGLGGTKDIEEYKARYRKRIEKEIEIRNLILDTPGLKKRALEYAESVRQKNVELLRSYGLEINSDKGTTAVKINDIATKKKLTLNAAFKQVFGEALEPLGFKSIEAISGFVRVIDHDVIQIIRIKKNETTIIKASATDVRKFDPRSRLSFNIYCTVFSIYDDLIDRYFEDINCHFYKQQKSIYESIEKKLYDTSMYDLTYYQDNTESLINAMNEALRFANDYMLPMLDKMSNIEGVIDFMQKYFTFANIFPLTLILDDARTFVDKKTEEAIKALPEDQMFFPDISAEGIIKDSEEFYSEIIEFKNDLNKYKAFLKDMKNKKDQNIARLIDLGVLDI